MDKVVSLEEVLQAAEQLSVVDKVRLIEKIAPQIKQAINTSKPRKSLRGLWRGVDISAEDIEDLRREMWSDFPREE